VRAGVASAAFVGSLLVAGGASATESTVYPGVGIGKLRLGMTLAQVAKSLGPYSTVDERSRVAGSPYLEVGWNFGTWTVGFLRGQVVFVGTTLRAQRTPSWVRTRFRPLEEFAPENRRPPGWEKPKIL